MAQKSHLKQRDRRTLKRYVKKIASRIRVEQAVLFGSYAYGKPTKHSDIDLIILSSDFQGMSFSRRLIFLSRLRKDIAEDIALDVLGYTPKEFASAEKESAILAKAKTHGIRLQ